MSKIIKATDYGYRKVMQVALNPDDPEWVHIVGEQVRDANGIGVLAADNSTPVLITSATVPDGETGRTCHNCRYNWNVREFVWTGDAELKKVVDGVVVNKTDDDLANEVTAALAAASTTTANIAPLVNRVI
jgi:hypothetical protein